jgi:hypothetical protein
VASSGAVVRTNLLVITLLSLAGCTPLAGECRLNSDCPPGATCAAGRCAVECREDRDCAGGRACVEGRCGGAPDAGRDRLCVSARECADGETCLGGLCSTVTLVVDAGTAADVDGGGGAGPDASAPDGGAGPVADGGVAASLPYGAPCTGGSQCASGLCLGAGSTGRCTVPCTADAQCFYPDRCLEVPGAGRLCGSSGSGAPAGAPCPGGSAECASGMCLALAGRPPVCTQPCASLPTCPAGMTCVPIPDGAGSSSPLCAPGSGLGFGAACTASSQCFTQLCLGVGSGGVCTIGCAQVPCPAGYACVQVEDGSGGTVPICAPSGAGGGGFGAACTGASSCASGLCLEDPRVGGAFCTAPCRGDADCRQVAGLACVTLADGTRVCAPP